MFRYTDTTDAPWTVVRSNDKKRSRLAAMRHILQLFDYADKDTTVVGEPNRQIVGRGVDLWNNASHRRKPARDAQLADLAGPATRTRRGNSQRTSGRSAPSNCGQIIRSPQLLAAARRVGNGVAAIGRGRRSRGWGWALRRAAGCRRV